MLVAVIPITYSARLALDTSIISPNQFYYQTDSGDPVSAPAGYYQWSNGWNYRPNDQPFQLLQTNVSGTSGYSFMLEIDECVNPQAASSAFNYGIRSSIFTDRSLLATITGGLTGLLQNVWHYAATVVASMTGMYAYIGNIGSGTITTANAFTAQVDQNSASGTITVAQSIIAYISKTVGGIISYGAGLMIFGIENAVNSANVILGANSMPNGQWNFYSYSALPSIMGKASYVFGDNSTQLATNATDGFVYVPSCAGTPTGVPTSRPGTIAMVYDTSANKIWFYNGAWRGVVVA